MPATPLASGNAKHWRAFFFEGEDYMAIDYFSALSFDYAQDGVCG